MHVNVCTHANACGYKQFFLIWKVEILYIFICCSPKQDKTICIEFWKTWFDFCLS